MTEDARIQALAPLRARFATWIASLKSLVPVALLAAIALVAFRPSMSALAALWSDPFRRTYEHGYLIAAIVAWLIYRDRHRLAALPARPSVMLLAAGLAASLAWAVAVRAGIQTAHLVIWPVALWCSAGGILGWRAARILAFPLACLYLAMPIWEPLLPWLQHATVAANRVLIGLAGIPAWVEGSNVHLAAGTFAIDERCSGLSYLVAGVSLAVLLGQFNREPARRRWLLVVLAGVLALVSNWLRVFTVIVAGHLTDMQHYLVQVDHIGLGWVLFGIVFVVFFLLVRLLPATAAVDGEPAAPAAAARGTAPAVLLVAIAAFAAGPVLVAATARSATDGAVIRAVDVAGWEGPMAAFGGWHPVIEWGGCRDAGGIRARRGPGVCVCRDLHLPGTGPGTGRPQQQRLRQRGGSRAAAPTPRGCRGRYGGDSHGRKRVGCRYRGPRAGVVDLPGRHPPVSFRAARAGLVRGRLTRIVAGILGRCVTVGLRTRLRRRTRSAAAIRRRGPAGTAAGCRAAGIPTSEGPQPRRDNETTMSFPIPNSCIRVLAMACAIVALAGCDLLTSADTRMERAEAHLAGGDYRAALIEAQKVLQGDLMHARARLLLAEAELGLGEAAAAEADLERAINAGASDEAAAPLRARVHLALGRYQELYDQLESGDIRLPEPHSSTFRGQALLGLGRPQEALEAFQAALASDPRAGDARLGAAEAKAAAGDITAALADLAEIAPDDPQVAGSWLVRGRLLLHQGRPAEADAAFGEALARARGSLTEPQQLQALAGQVESRLALGQVDGAGEALGVMSRRAPNAIAVRILKARLAMTRQDFDAAVLELQDLASRQPDYMPARFLLGSALLAQGRLNQAELHLAAVVRAHPDNLAARKNLAEVRLRGNRPEQAIEALTPALQGTVSDPRAEALMSAAQLAAGADPSAVSRLESSVARNPGDRSARLDLATVYLAAGRAEQAVELLRATPAATGDAKREFLLIRALSASKGPAAARAEVERLLAERGDDLELLSLAAQYLLSAGDAKAAIATLERALRLEPGHVPSLIGLGRARILAGDLDEAEAVLRRALARDGASAEARMGLAEIAGRRNRPDEARRWLEEVRAGDSKAIGSRLILARLYLSDQESAKAGKVLGEVLAAAPDRADVLAAVGHLQLDFGAYEQALGHFRKAADLEPGRAEHWLNMARAQAALDYGPAARESVDKALALEPDSVAAVSFAVLMDLRDGRKDAALDRALDLRKRVPRDAGAAMLEGDVRSSLGQHALAAGAYAEAARLQPQLAAVVRLARSRMRAGLRDADAPLRDWLKEHPDDLQGRSVLAAMLHEAGQVERAIVEYERLLDSGRPNAAIANNLAWLYFERGDARAEALARQAYALAPTSGAIADTLGWILVNKGSTEEGIKLLRAAAARSPGEPEIQLHLAEGLAKAGQADEARRVLTTLLAGDRPFNGRDRARQLLASLGG